MTSGRVNQKARTRAAIVDAAIEIFREGREPTVPEAAERARVSPATAYRYFTSADDLQAETIAEVLHFVTASDEVDAAIDGAGDDVHARLAALMDTLGRRMVTDQAPFRQQARAGQERWFTQQRPSSEPGEVRAGRRVRFLRRVLAPVEDQLPAAAYDRLLAALAVGFGTEAVTSLVDIAGLGPDEALEVMGTTCRWILDAGLAEAAADASGATRAGRRRQRA